MQSLNENYFVKPQIRITDTERFCDHCNKMISKNEFTPSAFAKTEDKKVKCNICHRKDGSSNTVYPGFIYLMKNKAWPGWIKVGVSSNVKNRLNQHQTSSPFRDFEIIDFYEVENKFSEERKVHNALEHNGIERNGEWFNVEESELERILDDCDLYSALEIEVTNHAYEVLLRKMTKDKHESLSALIEALAVDIEMKDKGK